MTYCDNITYCEPGATRYTPRHCCNSNNQECTRVGLSTLKHTDSSAGREASTETVLQAARQNVLQAGRQTEFSKQANRVQQAG